MWFRKKNKGEGGVGTGISSGQFAEKMKSAPGAPARLSVAFAEQKASSITAGDLLQHQGRDLEITRVEPQRSNPGWIDGPSAPLKLHTLDENGARHIIHTTEGAMLSVIRGGATTHRRQALSQHRFGYGPKVASAVQTGDYIDRDGEEWEVIGRHETRGVDAQLRLQIRRADTALSTQSWKVSHTEMLSVSETRGKAKRWQVDQLKAPMHLGEGGSGVSLSVAERATEDAIDHGRASRQAAERTLRGRIGARVAVSGLRNGDLVRAAHPGSGIPDQATVADAQMNVRAGRAVTSYKVRFTDGSEASVDGRPFDDTVEVLRLQTR